MYSFIAPHMYNSSSRKVAIGIKHGDYSSIMKAAEEMASYISSRSILVPMPSHWGYATETFKLAQALSQLTGAAVVNVLRGIHRKTLYAEKRSGNKVSWSNLGLFLSEPLPADRRVYVIDNCIDTGASGRAAAAVIGNCTILAYAMTKKTLR